VSWIDWSFNCGESDLKTHCRASEFIILPSESVSSVQTPELCCHLIVAFCIVVLQLCDCIYLFKLPTDFLDFISWMQKKKCQISTFPWCWSHLFFFRTVPGTKRHFKLVCAISRLVEVICWTILRSPTGISNSPSVPSYLFCSVSYELWHTVWVPF